MSQALFESLHPRTRLYANMPWWSKVRLSYQRSKQRSNSYDLLCTIIVTLANRFCYAKPAELMLLIQQRYAWSQEFFFTIPRSCIQKRTPAPLSHAENAHCAVALPSIGSQQMISAHWCVGDNQQYGQQPENIRLLIWVRSLRVYNAQAYSFSLLPAAHGWCTCNLLVGLVLFARCFDIRHPRGYCPMSQARMMLGVTVVRHCTAAAKRNKS